MKLEYLIHLKEGQKISFPQVRGLSALYKIKLLSHLYPRATFGGGQSEIV